MAGIALPTKGRGAAVADFNLDGMLDLLVVNRGQPASLFRNLGGKTDGGTAADGQLAGDRTAAARRQPRRGRRHDLGQDRHACDEPRRSRSAAATPRATSGFVHVGLGTAERAEIRVQWPDGEWSHPYRVFANNFVLIDRRAAPPTGCLNRR